MSEVFHDGVERYFDRTFQCPALKLLPGQYSVGRGDELLVTVLGLCFGVSLLAGFGALFAGLYVMRVTA